VALDQPRDAAAARRRAAPPRPRARRDCTAVRGQVLPRALDGASAQIDDRAVARARRLDVRVEVHREPHQPHLLVDGARRDLLLIELLLPAIVRRVHLEHRDGDAERERVREVRDAVFVADVHVVDIDAHVADDLRRELLLPARRSRRRRRRAARALRAADAPAVVVVRERRPPRAKALARELVDLAQRGVLLLPRAFLQPRAREVRLRSEQNERIADLHLDRHSAELRSRAAPPARWGSQGGW
jgi:hypothetical protein